MRPRRRGVLSVSIRAVCVCVFGGKVKGGGGGDCWKSVCLCSHGESRCPLGHGHPCAFFSRLPVCIIRYERALFCARAHPQPAAPTPSQRDAHGRLQQGTLGLTLCERQCGHNAAQCVADGHGRFGCRQAGERGRKGAGFSGMSFCLCSRLDVSRCFSLLGVCFCALRRRRPPPT